MCHTCNLILIHDTVEWGHNALHLEVDRYYIIPAIQAG